MALRTWFMRVHTLLRASYGPGGWLVSASHCVSSVVCGRGCPSTSMCGVYLVLLRRGVFRASLCGGVSC